MNKVNNNQQNPARHEKVCFNCRYMAWMVALGQGIRCTNPESELTKSVQDRKDIALKIGLIPNRRHTCELFEFKTYACALPDPVSSENSFEIIIDDVQVKGEITHRSARDIAVKIISPFKGLSRSCHIPVFGASSRSYEGEYGDSTASFLLTEIYLYCMELNKNKKVLNKSMSEFRYKTNGVLWRSGQLDASIHALKIKMKGGLISSVEYQKEIKPLKKQLQEYKHQTAQLFDELVRSHIKEIQAVGSDEELIEYIFRL